ncbi:MAG TPA: hypothetical protein EYQ82_01165 [Dehalococcoidia bacterium]|nr:hypothetical protein [Dehalococcoidia bacterium]
MLREFYGPFDEMCSEAQEKSERVSRSLLERPTGEMCPTCAEEGNESPLVIRIGRNGEFIGCSTFPACKHTSNIRVETGVKCPETGGELLERKKQGRNRPFYGCESFGFLLRGPRLELLRRILCDLLEPHVERLRRHQVIQFHLRDAGASARDLRMLLQQRLDSAADEAPAVALLFSCLGRGEGLYGVAGHDSGMIVEHLGELPIGGFFCGGEIGPVQGRTRVHGFTSSIALLRAP